jgi:ATP-dependent helicase HrpA
VELRLGRATAPALRPAVEDLRAQLARLVHPGFVSATGSRRLADALRYLGAMERRLERLTEAPGRDRDLMLRVQRLEDEYERLLAQWPPGELPVEVEHIHWMLEELRVSFWAQSLGTAYAVSEQRILREISRAR